MNNPHLTKKSIAAFFPKQKRDHKKVYIRRIVLMSPTLYTYTASPCQSHVKVHVSTFLTTRHAV